RTPDVLDRAKGTRPGDGRSPLSTRGGAARRRGAAVLLARPDQRDAHEPVRGERRRTRAGGAPRRRDPLLSDGPAEASPGRLRVLYFGTYERDYPRNAQVVSALREAGVAVVEGHVSVWEGRRDNWRAGAAAAGRRPGPARRRPTRRAGAG